MAMHERSILDAPVTPAPLFAYRALRGIFFTEPDSSPAQPAYSNDHHNNTDDYDKENNNPNHLDIDLEVAKVKLSPIAVRLTPKNTAAQKRKRNGEDVSDILVSPTKSILRTPGVNTPRRAMLRDLNVKFMGDVRGGSVSPEFQAELVKRNAGLVVPILAKSMSRKGTELEAVAEDVLELEQSMKKNRSHRNIDQDFARVIEKGLLDIDFEVEPKVSNKRKQGTRANQKGLDVPDQQVPPQSSLIVDSKSLMSTSTTSDFNFQNYITKTEKEMKRLIRYSQKMREYARKQDEENVKLKLMLEEVKKENSRLKQELNRNNDSSDDVCVRKEKSQQNTDRSSRTAKTGITVGSAMTQKNVSSDVTRAKPNPTKYEDEARTHPKRQIKDTSGRLSTTESAASISSSSSGSLTITTLPVKSSNKFTSNPQPKNNNSIKPHRTFSATSSSSSSLPTKPLHPSSTSTSSTPHPSNQKPPQNSESSTRPTTLLLPSDRLAAARARVRQKAEARKASTTESHQPPTSSLHYQNHGFNNNNDRDNYESKTGSAIGIRSGIGMGNGIGESILDWADL